MKGESKDSPFFNPWLIMRRQVLKYGILPFVRDSLRSFPENFHPKHRLYVVKMKERIQMRAEWAD